MKTLQDIDIKNKKVIIRCDFNVPLKNGRIVDDTRIKASLDTINYCLKNNCKIILLSHLGRVKEESDLTKNNMKPVARRLEKLLDRKVKFINQTRGKRLEKSVSEMNEKDIILIQNTRYEDLDGKKESSNDLELGKYWASLGDVFINDAFGTLHRAHASNVGIASNIQSCIGLLVEKELKALNELNSPEKPFIVILGGSKVKDKIGVIENLVTKANKILIGGGMAFTFLQADGFDIGNSIVDYDSIELCQTIMKKYPEKIILPIDIATSKEFNNESEKTDKDINELEYNDIGLDIGPKSVKIFKKYLKDAKMVLWNGPLGVYEFKNYRKATTSILKYLVKENIKTILGGGDIVAAASISKTKDKIYHASTGGGATLEYLEGKKLPGLEIIK